MQFFGKFNKIVSQHPAPIADNFYDIYLKKELSNTIEIHSSVLLNTFIILCLICISNVGIFCTKM